MDKSRVIPEIQTDGSTVLRYIKDTRYDAGSIEGRTGGRAAEVVGNRYDAVIIAANRVRELNRGDAPKILRTQGNRVTAIQEMEQGLVGYEIFHKIYKNSRRHDRHDK